MKIIRFFFRLGLAIGMFALALLAFARRDSAKAANSGRYEAIDDYVQEQMHRLEIPGVSLAIVEGDKITHLRGFGRARAGAEAPSPQTPFAVGSLAKSFTALAVMQLVEAGKAQLDAPVQCYLPWFRVADPLASAQITVRHLLNQTSGLPTSAGETPLSDFDDSPPGAAERQARTLATLALARPPGSRFEYSNSNYALLGLIVEAASGQSYGDYIQSHIFSPLGMNHSYTSEAEAEKDGLAMGHQYWFGIPFPAPNIRIPPGALAGGGLISSAEDLGHYLIALLNGGRYGDLQILSAAGVEELQRGAADFAAGLGPVERFLVGGVSLGQYGMGWCVDESGPTKVAWHGGTLPDYGAFMSVLPEEKKGLVLLFNACHHWMNPVQATFGGGATTLLAGGQPSLTPFIQIIPWALRGLLLIPALQIADIVATLSRLRRLYRSGASQRPRVILPLLLNLLPALLFVPLLGKRRGYMNLYMPDIILIGMVSGGLALVWAPLRTWLVRRPPYRVQEEKP